MQMTAQNVVFVIVLIALGLACLFHLRFILHHMLIIAGGVTLAIGALFYLTRRGLVDWDSWIPRGRD
jgi:predicted membrane channel-forming protein YqfA (hemolysin III family)